MIALTFGILPLLGGGIVASPLHLFLGGTPAALLLLPFQTPLPTLLLFVL